MKKFIEAKPFLIFTSFVVGGLFTYFIFDYIQLKQSQRPLGQTANLQYDSEDKDFKISPDGRRPVDRDEKITIRPNRNYRPPQKKDLSPVDPFDSMDRMRKLMDQMFQDSFHMDSFPDSDTQSFSFKSGSDLKIDEKEDDSYKYIIVEAEGLDKDGLNIKIEKGMISISGEIRKTHQENGYSSTQISSFSQAFSIPSGVDAEKVKFENSKDKIVLKFPKSG